MEGASLLPIALSLENLDSKLESECLAVPSKFKNDELVVGLVGVQAICLSDPGIPNLCSRHDLYLSIRVEKSLYVTSTSSTQVLIDGACACPVCTRVSASCKRSFTRSRVSLAFSY